MIFEGDLLFLASMVKVDLLIFPPSVSSESFSTLSLVLVSKTPETEVELLVTSGLELFPVSKTSSFFSFKSSLALSSGFSLNLSSFISRALPCLSRVVFGTFDSKLLKVA